MTAYYNEIDPYAAQWLRNLIAAGHIAPGEVDTRSILDVSPDDLADFTQCHFFAGVGVWSFALRWGGGWPDDRPAWTGSCPCQPFSVAGMGNGMDDQRHLWPYWFHLVAQRRPAVVFGEQVEAAVRHAWLDLVQSDLEGIGYAFGAVVFPAAGVGAPHARHRLFFVADADDARLEGGSRYGRQSPAARVGRDADAGSSTPCRLEHASGVGRDGRQATTPGHVDDRPASERTQGEHGAGIAGPHRIHQHDPGPTNGYWRNADWLRCRDEQWRPVEPGAFPLAHGATGRVGRLRAYGNAICAPLAAEFVSAYLECRP